MMKNRITIMAICLLAFSVSMNAQNRSAARIDYLIGIIDSLDRVMIDNNNKIERLDSLLEAEKAETSLLREENAAITKHRKELETNVSTFQGENLKLNQSNRILIIFNSFVAVLLIVTLVFYLRKMNRKTGVETVAPGKPVSNHAAAVHASFEDKLQQLERLGKLREKGYLSDEEFLAEKNQILGK